MTISTTASRISYNGNGATVAFSFPYRFLVNGDVVVVLRSSAGVESTLLLGTHYSLTGAGDDAGGTVTMVTAPAVGERLVIYRVVALTQETDYISGGPFPAETHERALDRLTMASQQLQDSADRTLRFPVSDTVEPELPTQAARANRLLGFDADGNPVALTALPDASYVISAFGESLIDDADEAAAQTTLGGTTVGKAVFTASDEAAARAAIGKPSHYFSAQLSSGSISVSALTLTDVVLPTEVFDVGSNYDTATGIFTAPVTGLYEFSASLTITASSGTAILEMLISSVRHAASTNIDSAGTYATLNLTRLVTMTAGQTAQIKAYSSSTSIIYARNGLLQYLQNFSGRLIHTI